MLVFLLCGSDTSASELPKNFQYVIRFLVEIPVSKLDISDHLAIQRVPVWNPEESPTCQRKLPETSRKDSQELAKIAAKGPQEGMLAYLPPLKGKFHFRLASSFFRAKGPIWGRGSTFKEGMITEHE